MQAVARIAPTMRQERRIEIRTDCAMAANGLSPSHQNAGNATTNNAVGQSSGYGREHQRRGRQGHRRSLAQAITAAADRPKANARGEETRRPACERGGDLGAKSRSQPCARALSRNVSTPSKRTLSTNTMRVAQQRVRSETDETGPARNARKTWNTASATRAPARRAPSTAGSAKYRRGTAEMPRPAPRAVMSGRGNGNRPTGASIAPVHARHDTDAGRKSCIIAAPCSRCPTAARSWQTPRTPSSAATPRSCSPAAGTRPARQLLARAASRCPPTWRHASQAARRRAPTVCPWPIFWDGVNSGRWSSTCAPAVLVPRPETELLVERVLAAA